VAPEQQEEYREPIEKGLEGKDKDDLTLIRHISAALLWSSESSPRSKLQDLNMQVQGSQKHSNEYVRWWQVACIGKHTYIDKSESGKHI